VFASGKNSGKKVFCGTTFADAAILAVRARFLPFWLAVAIFASR